MIIVALNVLFAFWLAGFVYLFGELEEFVNRHPKNKRLKKWLLVAVWPFTAIYLLVKR